MTDTSAMPVLEIMRQRFTSGNSIPVHSARITADEWDTIRAIIERHQQPNVDDFIAKLKEYLKNPDDTLFVKMGNISWVIHEFEKCLKK